MQEIVPIAFLPEHHALAVAIMSYNGRVDFGLLADYDAMPDIDAFASHLEESLAELLAASRAAGKASAKSNGRKKDGTPGTARKKTTTS
jgi:diacylglycerol O-acyltransferase / wax synthase